MAVASERLALLQSGKAATTTLTEVLAVDFAALLGAAVPTASSTLIRAVAKASDLGILKRMRLVAEVLHDECGPDILPVLENHASDTVRGWGCFVIALLPGVSLPGRLERMRMRADDMHFGVREWAWLAMRPHISTSLEEAVDLLLSWTGDASERIRRFACESTRPRGVWCAHIDRLKKDPSPGLSILEPLRFDAAPYVQDSVGNWLNDASKTQPQWTRDICARWRAERGRNKGIDRICRRALRSITK